MKTSPSFFALFVLASLTACQSAAPPPANQINTPMPQINRNDLPDPKNGLLTEPSPTPAKIDPRIQSLAFQHYGAKTLIYGLSQKDGTFLIELEQKSLDKTRRKIKVQDETLKTNLKKLFDGKAVIAGTRILNGVEEELVASSDETSRAAEGDVRTQIFITSQSGEEYAIKAPVIKTTGMEDLFDKLSDLIDQPEAPEAEPSPTPQADASPTPQADASPTPQADASPTPAADASPAPAGAMPLGQP